MIEQNDFTAITVRQPWATLLVLGIKKIKTMPVDVFKNFRGRLIIHAGRVDYQGYYEYESNEAFRFYCNDAYEKIHGRKPLVFTTENESEIGNKTYKMDWKYFHDAWPTEAIIGCVDLHDCKDTSVLKKEWNKAGKLVDWERESFLGDLKPGRFAWMCRNYRKFENPIKKVRGQVGMWNARRYMKAPDFIM